MKVRVHVDGLSEMSRAMKKLGINISGQGDSRMALRALHDGARPIVQEAKRLAPVLEEKTERTRVSKKGKTVKYRGSKRRRRGAIRANITQHTSRIAYNTVLVRVRNRGYIFSAKGKDAAIHGSPTYWWLTEFGTVKSPPRPFMRPAFDKMKGVAVEKIKSSLKAGLEYYTKNPANVGLDSQKLSRRRGRA